MSDLPIVRPGGLVCRVEDLKDISSKPFVIQFDDGEEVEIFLIRRGDEVFGYVNKCPHQAMALQWDDNSFLTSDGTRILCAVHGATFDIATGDPLSGPPLPDGCLLPVPITVSNGEVRLDPR